MKQVNIEFVVPAQVLEVLSVIEAKDALVVYQQVQGIQNRRIEELVNKEQQSLPFFMRLKPVINNPNPINYDVIVEVLNDLIAQGKARSRENAKGDLEYLLTR